jgi:hypothetical protein
MGGCLAGLIGANAWLLFGTGLVGSVVAGYSGSKLVEYLTSNLIKDEELEKYINDVRLPKE